MGNREKWRLPGAIRLLRSAVAIYDTMFADTTSV